MQMNVSNALLVLLCMPCGTNSNLGSMLGAILLISASTVLLSLHRQVQHVGAAMTIGTLLYQVVPRRLTHLLPKFHGLACNTQQFGVREYATSRIVNEVVAIGNQRLENKITELTSFVKQLAIGQHHISPPVRVYGICASIYNNHLLSNNNNFLPFLEDLVKQMATNNIQFQQNVISKIKELITEFPICTESSSVIHAGARVVDIADANVTGVVKVVEVQPPLPSIVQPLQPQRRKLDQRGNHRGD
ncbi:hypothetical protein CR513_19942, partial [Mucuna pruriens]